MSKINIPGRLKCAHYHLGMANAFVEDIISQPKYQEFVEVHTQLAMYAIQNKYAEYKLLYDQKHDVVSNKYTEEYCHEWLNEK